MGIIFTIYPCWAVLQQSGWEFMACRMDWYFMKID